MRKGIVAALKRQLSVRAVAAQIKVGVGTVGRIRRAIKEALPPTKNGRPRVLTDQQSARVAKWFESGVCTQAVDGVALVQEVFQIDVSPYVIHRALKENGFQAYVRTKKPFISKKNRKARMGFVKRHSDKHPTSWRRVLWSDESKINMFGSDGRQYTWRRPGEQQRDIHFRSTMKHGGGSLMVWGCFSAGGVGSLVRIQGKLDSMGYRQILQDGMLETYRGLGGRGWGIVFQHDNDPKHTAEATKQFLADEDVEVLRWPAQSPDLNPIEHLWAELKRRVRARPNFPTNRDQLWEAVSEEWRNIPESVCEALVDSIPKRLEETRRSRGGRTRY